MDRKFNIKILKTRGTFGTAKPVTTGPVIKPLEKEMV